MKKFDSLSEELTFDKWNLPFDFVVINDNPASLPPQMTWSNVTNYWISPSVNFTRKINSFRPTKIINRI